MYPLASFHRSDSNEYTYRTIISKYGKYISKLSPFASAPPPPPHLSPSPPRPDVALRGSIYSRLKQISMVPKMFAPSKFEISHLSKIGMESTIYNMQRVDRRILYISQFLAVGSR